MHVALFQTPTRAFSFCLFGWTCGWSSAAAQPLHIAGQATSIAPAGIDIIDIG